MDFLGFYWILLDFTGFYWVYWVLLGCNAFYYYILIFIGYEIEKQKMGCVEARNGRVDKKKRKKTHVMINDSAACRRRTS